jgi:hypothetical protein
MNVKENSRDKDLLKKRNGRTSTQDLSCLLCNPRFQYPVLWSPPFDFIFSSTLGFLSGLFLQVFRLKK